MLHWYAQRWKIETFHAILKSGCRAEQSKLRKAERLMNLLATFCTLGWRIFWITILNRSTHHFEAVTRLHATGNRRSLLRLVRVALLASPMPQ